MSDPSKGRNRDDERAAMGYLLERVSRLDFPATGLLISALVHYLDSNEPGAGFYALAVDVELVSRRATPDEKHDFWVSQVAAVQRHYSGGARSR